MIRLIFHVDVNSAFLSWEAVYRLKHLGGTVDLRECIAAVGGDMEKRHGIILAKSIPSKRYGIQTGESITEALQKCPELQIVPPHYSLYSKCSHALMELLHEYTPDVEQYSIDEAFLDMTETCQLFGSPVDTANAIRNRVEHELGFTVNIGVSSNKLLAKMASDFQKPNRVHTLFPAEIPAKMWVLPVSELFFVGRASFQKLYNLGIVTIGDLAHTDPAILRLHLKSHGDVLWHYANGDDTAMVESTVPKNKGYGNSLTIAFDISSHDTAYTVLLSIAESVGMRIRRDNAKIRVVSVSIKFFDFQHVSRQRTLTNATDITIEIYHIACQIFTELWDGFTPIRHLGIHTSRVVSESTPPTRQLSLFDLDGPEYEAQHTAELTIDQIRGRFGIDSVKRAAFLHHLPLEHVSGGITRDKEHVDYTKEHVE